MSLHWFDYLLCPDQLTSQLENNSLTKSENDTLLKELLTNLLNSQNMGFFTENPFELWFCDSLEKKVPVLRNLCLQLVSSLNWRLGDLEQILPPPLMLYILQAYIQSQSCSSTQELNKVSAHLDLFFVEIAQPGPVLHSLVIFHRWVLRTYMQCRTPHRLERGSNVMVPGVKRDPALIFRDQTNNLVLNLVSTSLRFLQEILQADLAPTSLPTPKSFSATNLYSLQNWEHLRDCDQNLFKSLLAYDLGCCYFFNEDYTSSKACFSAYFKYAENMPSPLPSDIQEAKLNGYVQCLGLTAPPVKNNNIKFLESAKDQLETLISSLEADTFAREISDVDIDNTEGELKKKYSSNPAKKELLTNLEILTLIRRTLKGLPLTGRGLSQLDNMGENGKLVFHKQVSKVLSQGSARDKMLIRNLVQKLILFGVIPQESAIVALFPDEFCYRDLEVTTTSLKTSIPLCETFNLKSICKYNAAVQLLGTFKVPMLTGLAKGLRPGAQVTQRWHMEDHYQRLLNKASINNMDDVSIILAKVNQLKKMQRWDEATEMLMDLTTELSSQLNSVHGVTLSRVVEGDRLCVEMQKNLEQEERGLDPRDATLRSQALTVLNSGENNVNLLQELCLNLIIRDGDWDSVNRCGMRGGAVPSLAKALTNLFVSITSNNPQSMKKLGREVWDLIVPYVSANSNKRKDQVASPIKDRNQVQRFLEKIRNLDLALLVLSLLATLFNVARDDPSTELLSTFPSVWPTGLTTNQSIQDKLVVDLLQGVLYSYQKRFPMDPNILQISADLNFANNNYRTALSQYTEMVAVRTDFFEQPIEQAVLSECCISRMVRCCSEMGRLIQAVVLGQLSQEPNYSQIFKYLEDRETNDAADSLYACIWDMTILEFAMSLHTRRGEVARRRHVLSCIMQLELNTNNEQEIKREAANIRKSIFFRSLALQLFNAP